MGLCSCPQAFLPPQRAGAPLRRGARGFSRRWFLLLQSAGSGCAGSVIVTHGLSGPSALGSSRKQGWNPCRLRWKADSYPLDGRGSSLFVWSGRSVFRAQLSDSSHFMREESELLSGKVTLPGTRSPQGPGGTLDGRPPCFQVLRACGPVCKL